MRSTTNLARHIRRLVAVFAALLVTGTAATAGPVAAELAQAEQAIALAETLRDQGRFAEAIPVAERAFALQERLLGPEGAAVARSLNLLAVLHWRNGNLASAQPLARRALAMREKVLGPEHPEVARSLNNLAGMLADQGEFRQAEALVRRALAMREKVLGFEHPEVADSLTGIAILSKDQGNYRQAEPLYRRALAIYEKASGPGHPRVAILLNNLANLYAEQGDYRQAELLYRRALALRVENLGPEHPDVAEALNNLALVLLPRQQQQEAEQLLREAVRRWEKALGPEHPDVAEGLNNLAEILRDRGDYQNAGVLLERSLAIRERVRGAQHPEVAQSLANLAVLHTYQGDPRRAEALFERALAIWGASLGREHPYLAGGLHNFALLRAREGRAAEALALLRRGLDIQEHNLTLTLATGAEARKRAYLATLTEGIDFALSVHLQLAPSDPAAARLALTTVLRHKGRVLDELSTALARLRERLGSEERALLDGLARDRAQLAALVFAPPGDPERYRQQVERLEQQIARWETSLAARSAEYRDRSAPVTVEAVERLLPPAAALIEMVRYRPYRFGAGRPSERFGPERYAAAVLRSGRDPVWFDLGSAAALDKAIGALRSTLRPGSAVTSRLGASLLARLGPALAESRLLLFAPDGEWNLVPLAALSDPEGKALLERYTVSYLGSGRDLLRLERRVTARQAPLLIAAPDFETGSLRSQVRSLDLTRLAFRPLPGVAKEGLALRRLLPGAQLLSGTAASESALKQVHGPLLLHIATHGFFLPEAHNLHSADPLLRSGLALSGFNRRTSGGEDGVLTALEAAGLDLDGTELVVLSACDTGLGQVAVGEGVYGLRRAFAVAGARSQLISLWKVNDEGTRVLMERFYRQLVAGVGRSEALRRAQLQMRVDRRYSHPFYWAGFILSGDWRSLRVVGTTPPRP